MPGLPVPRTDCRNWEAMSMSRDCQEACAPADHVCALRIRAALKAERRKLRQVEAAIASGDTARITDVIRMYTVSFAARVAALHHENKRRDWRADQSELIASLMAFLSTSSCFRCAS